MNEKNMPEWARKLEDWGKRMELKYGDGSKDCPCKEEKAKDSEPKPDNQKHKWPKDNRPQWQREHNPVGEIIGNIISYFIVTLAPQYFPSFFTDSYPAVRTVILLSILIHIGVSFLMIFLNFRAFHYLGRVIMDAAGIASMIVMVTIWPFNVPYGLGFIAQFALWVAIVIVSIVTLFNFLNIFGHDNQG